MKRQITWLALQECGAARKIIDITKILYDRINCKIFPRRKALRLYIDQKWCKANMYSIPNYFSANIRVMKRVEGLRKRAIKWSMKEILKDLDYADDICLLA